jgi:membrane-bound acyltransferase YfiQ involved in biofilm formation
MIAPIVYLGNWAIIALVIIVRFMIDQHPFFLETLAQVDNNISFLTTPQGGM